MNQLLRDSLYLKKREREGEGGRAALVASESGNLIFRVRVRGV